MDAARLSGKFDYDIRSHNASDAIAAYEDYLGLTLESRKGPIDVIVVDHVQAPSAN